MKIKFILFVITLPILIASCKSDDDNPLESNNILVNTTWEGDRAEDGIYTFTSNSDYTFKDPGEPFFDGTYSFDGRNGVLNEIVSGSSFTFEMVGDTMIIAYPDDTTRTYFKK